MTIAVDWGPRPTSCRNSARLIVRHERDERCETTRSGGPGPHFRLTRARMRQSLHRLPRLIVRHEDEPVHGRGDYRPRDRRGLGAAKSLHDGVEPAGERHPAGGASRFEQTRSTRGLGTNQRRPFEGCLVVPPAGRRRCQPADAGLHDHDVRRAWPREPWPRRRYGCSRA